VVVDTAAEGDPKALASDLEALGLGDPAVFGRMISGRLPLAAIPASGSPRTVGGSSREKRKETQGQVGGEGY